MKIEIDENLMTIEIYSGHELISRLKFDMCDEDDLRDNAKELSDLLASLNLEHEITEYK